MNYRFPGVYIESNLVTVRNTPVLICRNFAVIELILTIDSIQKLFLSREFSIWAKVPPEDRFLLKQQIFRENTQLKNTSCLT